MAIKLVGRDTSVALHSEGLGRKKWYGRVAILIKQHTISAGEMLAAFASENRPAKIVGQTTSGRLIPGQAANAGLDVSPYQKPSIELGPGERSGESVFLPM